MRICDPLIAFPNYIVSEVRNPNCNYIGTPVTELASAPANDLTSIRISTTNLQQFDCKLFKLNSLAVKRCPRELSKPWISRVSSEVFKAKIQENSPREPSKRTKKRASDQGFRRSSTESPSWSSGSSRIQLDSGFPGSAYSLYAEILSILI